MKLALFGKVEFDSYSGELTMLHPEFEILSGDDEDGEASLHTGRIVPIYEAAGKLTTRVLRTLTHRILQPGRAGAGLPARASSGSGCKLSRSLTRRSAQTHFPPPDSDLRLLNAFPLACSSSAAHFRGVLLAGMRGRAEAGEGAHAARHRASRSTTACASA